MRRLGLLGVLTTLLALPGCGPMTSVAPPPVVLSALEEVRPAPSGDLPLALGTPETTLLRVAPPGALLTLHLPDLARTRETFSDTALRELLTSPEMASALGPMGFALGMLSDPTAGGGFTAGSPFGNPAMLAANLEGEIVFSLVDMEFLPGALGLPSLQGVAAISVPGQGAQMGLLLEGLVSQASQDRSLRIERGIASGTDFVRVLGETPFPYVLELAVHDDALLAGLGRDTVTAAIARLIDDTLPALEDSPSYVAALDRCSHPDDVLRVHAQIDGLLVRVRDALPADQSAVLEGLDLDSIRSIGGAIRFAGRDVVTTSLIDAPEGTDRITRTLRGHAVDRTLLDRIPDEVTSFSLFALDPVRVLREVRGALPEGPRRGLVDALDALRERGFDLERDVLASLGSQGALVTVPVTAGSAALEEALWSPFLGSGLVWRVRDAGRLRTAIERLPADADGWPRREETIHGRRVLVYDFDAAELPTELALCIAVEERELTLALSRSALRRMLAGPGEEARRHYEQALADVPAQAVVIGYDDVRRGFAQGLQALASGFEQGMPGGAVDPVRSSEIDALVADLGPGVSWTLADANGVTNRSRSPTGGIGSTGGFTGVIMLGSVAVPNLTRARLRSNETAALVALRALHTAQRASMRRLERDRDRDGDGEFGFLRDLVRQGTSLPQGLEIPAEGDVRGFGYRYRVYLPAEDGAPIGGHADPERRTRVDGDLAESVMVIVAWPIHRGGTGNRTFLMTGDGDVFICDDGGYGGDSPPPPDLVSTQKGNIAAALIPEGGAARDGRSWLRLRR